MKYGKAITAVSLALFLIAGNTWAACPTIAQQGNPTWYRFDVDSSCLSASGASATTLSCGSGGYSYGSGFGNNTSWSFTVPADGTAISNGTYYRLGTWSATIYVDFSSPSMSAWDTLYARVQVTSGGNSTIYDIVYLSGSTASTQTCGRFDGYFSATNGDTITVIISSSKWGTGSNIASTVPIVFNS